MPAEISKIQVEKISDEVRETLKIPSSPENTSDWSVWECEPSTFDWTYSQIEKAYVYEGKVKVTTDECEVEINAGDFVTFPKGLSCQWQVIEPIRKVYKFE